MDTLQGFINTLNRYPDQVLATQAAIADYLEEKADPRAKGVLEIKPVVYKPIPGMPPFIAIEALGKYPNARKYQWLGPEETPARLYYQFICQCQYVPLTYPLSYGEYVPTPNYHTSQMGFLGYWIEDDRKETYLAGQCTKCNLVGWNGPNIVRSPFSSGIPFYIQVNHANRIRNFLTKVSQEPVGYAQRTPTTTSERKL